MAKDYDVGKAFRDIEMELIQSMQRNMSAHVKQQFLENINWVQWQAEMLKGFNVFKTENATIFPDKYKEINKEINATIKEAYKEGYSKQEISILNAIKKGYTPRKSAKGVYGEFFKINERKMNALMKATTNDVKIAEKAVLRMTNDVYRKTIFNAHVFANTGAGTIEQAVDMATNDFLNAGINCVQYSNGARVNIASYAEMAVRTANKRAYLQGEAVKREEWGIHTVYVTAHNTACPLCQDWQGLVYVDDEFGEGTASESKDLAYPLLSDAIAGGLFHPNCRNGMTTFFEGVNDEPAPPTDEDKAEQQENYEQAQQKSYNNRQILRYRRLREGSLDEDNKAKYKAKEKQWRERQSLLKKPSILSDNKYKLLPNDIMKDVRKAEQSISEDSIENLLIYDRKGNLLISEAGISSKVEVPKSSKKNIKGCIMTHNHPSGKTFSVEDVQTLFFSGVAELRATTKDGTFILRQPKTWHKGLSRPYKIRKEYEDILYSLQDKYIDIYNRDGLLLNQVEAMWTDETLKIFTKKFGLEYKFERW